MEFKIDYGSVPLKQNVPAPEGKLYASINGRVSSLANGEVVFFDPATERLHVMTEQVLGALDVCRPFRTLDEQIDAVRKAMPTLAPQGDAVKRVLESLIARGLLVSDSDWLAHLTRDVASPQAEFAGLFIRACDRPAQVQRLLKSLLDYERRYTPAHRYTLIDDSRDNANAREHRRLLLEFAAAAKVDARYVGADEWSRIADLLTRGSAHAEPSEWLLRRMPDRRPHGGGLAMNLIAVLAAGRRYALLDDDFVFPLRLHPELTGRTNLGPTAMQTRFFGSVEAAMESGRDYEYDPLQDHLDACGASLGALVNRHPRLRVGRAELQGLAPSTLPHLENGRRIIATVNGHRGHSGAGTSDWMFLLDPASRAGLWNERASYLRHLESPSLWYGPTSTSIHAGGNFTPFTVDASEMVPYTNPSGRGEDRLFGALCRFVEPESLTAHLPTSIGHLQERERNRAGSLKAAHTPTMNAYLAEMALGSVNEFHATQRGARLRGLAARLRDMSWASDATIIGDLREHLTYVRSDLIQRYQTLLTSTKDAPIYWQADLRLLIEANGKALTQSSAPRLADWNQDIDAAGCAQRYRETMVQHADALEAWPELWNMARDQAGKVWDLAR